MICNKMNKSKDSSGYQTKLPELVSSLVAVVDLESSSDDVTVTGSGMVAIKVV